MTIQTSETELDEAIKIVARAGLEAKLALEKMRLRYLGAIIREGLITDAEIAEVSGIPETRVSNLLDAKDPQKLNDKENEESVSKAFEKFAKDRMNWRDLESRILQEVLDTRPTKHTGRPISLEDTGKLLGCNASTFSRKVRILDLKL